MSKSNFSDLAKANLFLLAAGLLFGLSSPLARIVGEHVQPLTVVLLRFLFALPFALLPLIFLKQRWKFKFSWGVLLFAGLFPISVCFYTLSLFYTKVSLAIFSFYAANLISSILFGVLFAKERVTKAKAFGFCFALLAVFILTDFRGAALFNTGILFGYASGIIQTIASLFQKRLSATIPAVSLTVVQIFGGLIVAASAVVLVGDVSIYNSQTSTFAFAILFGLMNFLINFFMIRGFAVSDIGTGTILLSSELVFGPIAAYFIFNETLGSREALAGVLIIIAVCLCFYQKRSSVEQGA